MKIIFLIRISQKCLAARSALSPTSASSTRAVKTIDGETVLDFEALTDYHAMRRIEAFVASKLQTNPDPKRRKV